MSSRGLDLGPRRALLSAEIQRAIAGGGRVELHNDTNAVIVTGRPVNHLLHAAIGLFTNGLWWIAWFFLIRSGGESRQMIEVDQQGRVSIQRYGPERDTTIEVIAGVLAGVALLWLLFLVLLIVASIAAAANAS